jgi:hypothetical protein
VFSKSSADCPTNRSTNKVRWKVSPLERRSQKQPARKRTPAHLKPDRMPELKEFEAARRS